MNRFSMLFATLAMSAAALAGQTAAVHAQSELTAQGLSTGQPVDTTRQPGDTYVKEEIGDWALRCIVQTEGEDPCQLYQLLANDQGVPIAEFSMFRLSEGQPVVAGATVIVPLETSLQQQLSIAVDEEQAKRYPFSFCNQIGCYARIGLTEEDIASYKRGREAVLTIVPMAAPDQQVTVTLSLTGFTAAIDSPLLAQVE